MHIIFFSTIMHSYYIEMSVCVCVKALIGRSTCIYNSLSPSRLYCPVFIYDILISSLALNRHIYSSIEKKKTMKTYY